MNTYREAYIAALEQALLEGGQLAEVETTVAKYNTFSQADFERWLASVKTWRCLACGQAFDRQSSDPDAQILCGRCGQ